MWKVGSCLAVFNRILKAQSRWKSRADGINGEMINCLSDKFRFKLYQVAIVGSDSRAHLIIFIERMKLLILLMERNLI